MEWYHIYFLTRLPEIREIAVISTILSGVALVVVGVNFCVENLDGGFVSRDEERAVRLLFIKRATLFFVMALLLATAIPDKQTIAAMYILPKVARSDAAKELEDVPADLAKLLSGHLRLWLEDLETKEASGGDEK